MANLSGYHIAGRFTTPHQPYRLYPGPHLFCDIRFIGAGSARYVDEQGQVVETRSPEGAMKPCYADPQDVPYGISVVAQKAEKSEPLDGVQVGTIIHDQGIYRSWDGANYSESSDGFVWTKPKIPGERNVQNRNRLFFPGLEPHGPGVFVDPAASSDERYKMVFMGNSGPDGAYFRHYLETRPEDVDPVLWRRGGLAGIYGATSPDGLHWKLIEEPLVLTMADNPNTAYYDTQIDKYVIYTRCAAGYGRRCVGRSESDTFSNFPLPKLTLWADLTYQPSDDFYTNAHSIYPGTVDQHFIFPSIFNRGTDSCWIDIYSSGDGIHYTRIPGGPIVEGHPDDFDDGCLFTMGGGLVPLKNDRVGVMISGSSFPHKYPQWADKDDKGSNRYAMWKRGRLACIHAVEEGFFATPAVKFKGRELKLNFCTPLTGDIRVEVVAIRSWVNKKVEDAVVPGRTFADCDPLRGDHLSHTVTWRGLSDLGHAEEQAVFFRFKMRYAKLYAFEVV